MSYKQTGSPLLKRQRNDVWKQFLASSKIGKLECIHSYTNSKFGVLLVLCLHVPEETDLDLQSTLKRATLCMSGIEICL